MKEKSLVCLTAGGEVRNVTMGNCRLCALEEDALSRRPLYLCAFHAGPGAQRVKLLNNAHVGYPNFGNHVVGNRIRSPHNDRTGFTRQAVRMATTLLNNKGGHAY